MRGNVDPNRHQSALYAHMTPGLIYIYPSQNRIVSMLSCSNFNYLSSNAKCITFLCLCERIGGAHIQGLMAQIRLVLPRSALQATSHTLLLPTYCQYIVPYIDLSRFQCFVGAGSVRGVLWRLLTSYTVWHCGTTHRSNHAKHRR